jgi:hypothetical protein
MLWVAADTQLGCVQPIREANEGQKCIANAPASAEAISRRMRILNSELQICRKCIGGTVSRWSSAAAPDFGQWGWAVGGDLGISTMIGGWKWQPVSRASERFMGRNKAPSVDDTHKVIIERLK